MDEKYLMEFRSEIRKLERSIFAQNKVSCCDGVTLTQCHTLLEIDEHTSMNISELSDNLVLDKSTISRTVEGLVNIGLVDRDIPKENRRTALVQLSDQGKKTCKQINKSNNVFYDCALKGFTSDEKTEFLKLLKKFVRNVESI